MKAHPEEFEKRFKLSSSWRTTNMVAFDDERKLTRYNSAGHIMESFYSPRLAAYEERRLKEMERLKAEAVEADAKARFIRAVLEGSIDLRRKTDTEIIEIMNKHDLPSLAADKGIDGWEYLLRMRMDRVKASAIKESEDAATAAKAAVEELLATTAGAMWLRDLDDFDKAWATMVQQRLEAASNTGKKTIHPKKPRANAST